MTVKAGCRLEVPVLICHCRAVSDEALQRHMVAGVCHERDLIVRSGAGSRCGGCLPHLRKLLAEHAANANYGCGTIRI